MKGEYTNSLLILIPFAFLAYYASLWYFSGSRLRKGLQNPPGPKPKFITGNLHQVSPLEPWLTFTSWSKTYGTPSSSNPSVQSTIDCAGNLLLGPIVYFRLFNRKSIILNSGRVALDILDARSAIYSDRPVNWMAGELAGRKRVIFLTSFMDPRFKILRRLLQTD